MSVSFTTSGEIFPVKAAMKINSSNEQHLTAMFQKFLFSSRGCCCYCSFFFFVIVVVSCFFFRYWPDCIASSDIFFTTCNDLNELKDKAEKASPLTNG